VGKCAGTYGAMVLLEQGRSVDCHLDVVSNTSYPRQTAYCRRQCLPNMIHRILCNLHSSALKIEVAIEGIDRQTIVIYRDLLSLGLSLIDVQERMERASL